MKVKRNFKDSIFRMLYLDEKELLNLYNAVNGTNYTDVENLEINTLQNAIYMNMKNDVSFLFNFQVNLYEHQSTVNPNMPLRDLIYVSKLLQKMVRDCDLYGSSLVKIPAPRFVVFYNGTEKQPERKKYRLSDSFSKKQENPELELTVTVLNINAGNNAEILGNCKTLREYMQYTDRVRAYALQMPIEDAVEQAITECIKEDILSDFLKKNRAEAMEVSIFEYNEELHLANLRREGYEEGVVCGKIQIMRELLLELAESRGNISDELRQFIMEQEDIAKLRECVLKATNSRTVEEVEEILQNSIDNSHI